jgi:hypothetical protein
MGLGEHVPLKRTLIVTVLAFGGAALGRPHWAATVAEPLPSPAAALLSGHVHELGSPDPVLGALVELVGTTLSAAGDAHGAYALAGPAGTWVLRITSDGYAPLSRTVKLAAGQRRKQDFGLNPTAFVAAEITVKAHRDHPQVIQASVSQREIKEIPGSFGDALRAVQNLPGVGAPNDFSGQILVQGAGPQDNLLLIDNLPWPIPFHFGGLVSTVNPDLLDTVDLYEAGYSSRWGGSLASVVDAKTKAPDTDRLHLDADVSILEASAAVEGPLGLGDATFTLAGRRSYFELAGRAAKLPTVPSYWDSGASLDFSLGAHDHIHLLLLASDDSLDFTSTADSSSNNNGNNFSGTLRYDQDFQTGGFSWVDTALPGFVSTLTPYAYHTDSILGIDSFMDDTYRTSVGLKEEFQWQAGRLLGAQHELSGGGELEQSAYTFEGYFPRITSTANISFSDLTNMAAVASTVQVSGFSGYAYLQDRLKLGEALALTLGLHYDASDLVADARLNPRVSVEWKLDPRSQLSAAWGLYDQQPSALNVNPQFGNPGLQPEDAEHVVLAYQHQFNPALTFKLDGYYKALNGLVVSDPNNPNLYDNEGTGDVKGMDLYLKEDLGERFFGAVSYSLSKSERLNLPAQGWAPYQYDQPNIFTAIGSYKFSHVWSLGGKLRYTSGNLEQPAGSQLYTERLPDYLRLDVRVGREWRFQTWSLKLYGEVLNLLDRKNPAMEFVNSNTGQTDTVDDLPRMPNVGLEAKY